MIATWRTLPSQIERTLGATAIYATDISRLGYFFNCAFYRRTGRSDIALWYSPTNRATIGDRNDCRTNARFPFDSRWSNDISLRWFSDKSASIAGWLILGKSGIRWFRCDFRYNRVASIRRHMSTRDYSSRQLSRVMHSSTFQRHRIALTSKKRTRWRFIDRSLGTNVSTARIRVRLLPTEIILSNQQGVSVHVHADRWS